MLISSVFTIFVVRHDKCYSESDILSMSKQPSGRETESDRQQGTKALIQPSIPSSPIKPQAENFAQVSKHSKAQFLASPEETLRIEQESTTEIIKKCKALEILARELLEGEPEEEINKIVEAMFDIILIDAEAGSKQIAINEGFKSDLGNRPYDLNKDQRIKFWNMVGVISDLLDGRTEKGIEEGILKIRPDIIEDAKPDSLSKFISSISRGAVLRSIPERWEEEKIKKGAAKIDVFDRDYKPESKLFAKSKKTVVIAVERH